MYIERETAGQPASQRERARERESNSAMVTNNLLLGFMLVLMSSLESIHARPGDFPGWMGEKSFDTRSSALPFIIDPTKVINVSWKPRAFLHKGFLSEEECDHLIALATDGLQKSAVVDTDSGKSVFSQVRTSSGMFIPKNKDEMVSRIEDKIAVWTFLGKENGEQIQVLKYQEGEKYDPHYDYFHDKVHQAQGGHRIATVLMYLTDVAKGGETVFPEAKRGRHFSKDETVSDCANKGIAVKPKRGDALLFFSLSPSAIPDVTSLHGGCPVIEDEKWSATKWIHVKSFDVSEQDSGDCNDRNASCGEWAAYGECQKNPVYMIGTTDQPGTCRRSCKVC